MNKILVDADASPNIIKEIIYRAANRKQIETIFIANSWIKLPPSKFLKLIQVEQGYDKADQKIVDLAESNDLVITADIPLAYEVLNKKAWAINPRGYRYDSATIKSQLTMRDFNETLRASGIQTKGPDPLSMKNRHLFASLFEQWIVEIIN